MLATNGHSAKHVVPPATGEEIRSALGVTKQDRAIVRKAMEELGYVRVTHRRRAQRAYRKRKAK